MLLELQRRLLRRKFWRSRIIFLTIALTALCSGIILCWPLAAAPLFNAEPAAEEADQGQESKKQSNPPESGQGLEIAPEEKELLARAVYGEARGESFQGQVAVAAVILNRVEDPRFPDSIAGVIFQPMAFTAVSDGQFWLEPDQEAYRAVEKALQGEDPTEGALYYYNPATATSYWIFSRPVLTRIGRHLFAD
ncbi:MAG: cell wall hydrolase [Dethiobacteria bacterium]|jgi:spore germination cell wall hydrolase CwlJ-like protein